MTSSISELLKSAMKDETLIRFSSRFEDNFVKGYVLAVGEKFFVLALVSDRIRFDGYECFRVADIRDPRPDPCASFVEAALKARNENKPRCPIEVANIETLLTSATGEYPIIAIHQEAIDPDVCWIGRVLSVKSGVVSFLAMRPDASWEEDATDYNLRDITRVNFDGDYERALHLVGGDPPPNRFPA